MNLGVLWTRKGSTCEAVALPEQLSGLLLPLGVQGVISGCCFRGEPDLQLPRACLKLMPVSCQGCCETL